jgi:putative nucleotidyltransferase with HDIG domain
MPNNSRPLNISRFRDWWRIVWARCGWPRLGKSLRSARSEQGIKILLLVVLSLVMACFIAPQPQKPMLDYRINAIAQESIRAAGDFQVKDEEATRSRQQEMLVNLPPVFDRDDDVTRKIQDHLHRSLEFLQRTNQDITERLSVPPVGKAVPKKPTFAALYPNLLSHKQEFDLILGVTLPPAAFQLLAKSDFSPTLEALVVQVLEQIYRQGVIAKQALPHPKPKEIILRTLSTKEEQTVQAPFPFLQVDNLNKPAATYCREVASDFSPSDRLLVCDLVQHLVVPNISYNLAETLERQQRVLKELRPTYFNVKAGELILQEGERITPLHLAKLKAQNAAYTMHRSLVVLLGTFLCLALSLWLVYNLARVSLKTFSTRLRDLIFLATLIVVCLLVNYGLVNLGATVAPFKPTLGKNMIFAIPIGLGSIYAALFLGLETGLAVAFLLATLTAMLVPKAFPLFLYLMSAGLMGVWGVRSFQKRRSLINTGLAICGVNLLMVTACKLLEYPFTARDLLLGQALAVGGGLLTGILALGLSPIIETAFHYTSNLRLLELLNLDQPLLKELMLVAPGTYHHSLVVGQIVEATAVAIGANPLLAKAAAYYHDIGKIKKPAYFVENQYGGPNKHEKLAPSMSSLILTAHVKDGVELASKQHLGEAICDIIQQHHGTSLISFFYTKAKNQAADPDKVNIQDYRYPGPRPQTKEAGLVLVADQVEAASKTLMDPTPARIQGMVQKIVNNIFADGQLDECELTLKELHLIAKHCTKILSGIFHQRVHYPTPAEKTRTHEDLDKQPTKKNGVKSGNGQRKSQEDLRRLGMG